MTAPFSQGTKLPIDRRRIDMYRTVHRCTDQYMCSTHQGDV